MRSAWSGSNRLFPGAELPPLRTAVHARVIGASGRRSACARRSSSWLTSPSVSRSEWPRNSRQRPRSSTSAESCSGSMGDAGSGSSITGEAGAYDTPKPIVSECRRVMPIGGKAVRASGVEGGPAGTGWSRSGLVIENGMAGGSGSNGDSGGASASGCTGASAMTAASSGWQSSLLTSRSAAALAARARRKNSVGTDKEENGPPRVAVRAERGEMGEGVPGMPLDESDGRLVAAAAPAEALAAMAPGSTSSLPSSGLDPPARPTASPAPSRSPAAVAPPGIGAPCRCTSWPSSCRPSRSRLVSKPDDSTINSFLRSRPTASEPPLLSPTVQLSKRPTP
eukprot:scaffold11177_cov86-Isochrysis_galbana.AAC.1